MPRLLLLAALVAAAGCSGDGGTATVNGTVTLDGQPLKEGLVRFVPVDGQGQTASAEVKDGKFTATVSRGEMRVEFSAPKVVRQTKMYDTPDSPVGEETAELLPGRYNVQSTLTITVKGGTQAEKFELTSQ